jgi:D-tagatose-1,6-bisphosphate aldolase subunit GatZ/KbaZ
MNLLDQIIQNHKQGQPVGIPSICSAHPEVLRTAINESAKSGSPLLIEATCNQVNQDGGYTGMQPVDFLRTVRGLAAEGHLPPERLILGGDHLGPSPWQHLPAEQAMQKAERLIGDFVRAGYEKIHLDASMKLGGDDPNRPLEAEISAQRAARLARVAETACTPENQPRYVIGTEVPIPGGAKEHEEGVAVTRPEDVEQTIELTRRAFRAEGLESAWERVIAVVVQPGVEFGDDFVLDYRPEKAITLSGFIEGLPHLVYEAHSTDYQTEKSLTGLVRGHFAILKVGPALTFAYREALFSLARAEAEYIPEAMQSHLVETMDAVLLKNPVYWQKYYHGSEKEQEFARRYSLSDRMRYYWPERQAQDAVIRLMDNLKRNPIPLSLLSQYAPVQYRKIRAGELKNDPVEIARDAVARVIGDYRSACGG